MKTWKQRTFSPNILFGLLVIMAIAFIACPPDDNGKETEQAQDWEEESLSLFGGKSSMKIKGTGLTKTEWTNAKAAVAVKFDAAYDANQNVAAGFEANCPLITTTVEREPIGYTNYKAGDWSLFVYSKGINNLDVLNALIAIAGGEELIAKAKHNVRHKHYLANRKFMKNRVRTYGT